MNTGVEILLKRIQDCPDDFQYNINTDTSSRWNKLLMEALRSDVITEEEKTALRHEVTEMGRARFTERVLKELAGVGDETSEDPKSLEDVIKQYRATGISSVGQTQLSSGLAWANRSSLSQDVLDAQAYQSEMMRQHLDEHRAHINKVEVNKKSLLKRIIK